MEPSAVPKHTSFTPGNPLKTISRATTTGGSSTMIDNVLVVDKKKHRFYKKSQMAYDCWINDLNNQQKPRSSPLSAVTSHLKVTQEDPTLFEDEVPTVHTVPTDAHAEDRASNANAQPYVSCEHEIRQWMEHNFWHHRPASSGGNQSQQQICSPLEHCAAQCKHREMGTAEYLSPKSRSKHHQLQGKTERKILEHCEGNGPPFCLSDVYNQDHHPCVRPTSIWIRIRGLTSQSSTSGGVSVFVCRLRTRSDLVAS